MTRITYFNRKKRNAVLPATEHSLYACAEQMYQSGRQQSKNTAKKTEPPMHDSATGNCVSGSFIYERRIAAEKD